jgi:xylulokinase
MLYAGFDCSTQSLTAVVIDAGASTRPVVFHDSIAFDTGLPAFRTRHGVSLRRPGGVVHTDPLLWTAALDLMLGRLAGAIDARRLRAIGGSAQQHGSVYCGATPHVLTRPTSPIWMDTSTARECAEIEGTLGGAATVARLTGSRAFPRFTGPQIRKFAREEPDAYARTERIHLVSSYLASLLIDGHAPIDHGDGSGMTLMDIRGRAWSPAALGATAGDLAPKLPPLVRSSAIIGTLAPAWQARYRLPPASVVAWSGDNPCSMIGTGLVSEGQLAISLGTSDTVFGPMHDVRVSDDGTGHVFVSPTGDYMGITVFRNGSLARETIRDRFGLDWDGFARALSDTPPGNDGIMMLPWFEPEITPGVTEPKVVRHGLEGATPPRYVRAVVEGQMMAMVRHSAWMTIQPAIIYATGGASSSHEILQVMADVFDAPVCRFESGDSAALGAALRAWQADTRLAWSSVVAHLHATAAPRLSPIAANVGTYRAMRPHFAALESHALRSDRPSAGTPAH